MNKQGFTLIELVMILVIVGILAIVIIPNTTAISVLRLESGCQKLQSDLRYVQQMAMAQQVRFGISFDTGNESYFAYRVTTATKAKDPQTQGNLDVSFNQLNEFKGIEIVSTNFDNVIEFDSTGAPYNGSGVLLTSEGIIALQAGSGAYSKTVRVEPKTGKVKIQ